MISYAQNLEDVLLSRAFRGQSNGFYIDVGAWHPSIDSVTKHFYDMGWCGINIEPSTEYFQLLEAARPRDLNLRIAVGDRAEHRELYRYAASGLSTFRPDFAASYVALDLAPQMTECEVRTLRDICRAHVHDTIDFLKIDAEGWETAVIRGADWERDRPRLVLVEAVQPHPEAFLRPDTRIEPVPGWEEWQGFLCSFGYEFCYFDGLNRFYVREEDRELRTAFAVPPNVFDQYVIREHFELSLRVAELTSTVERLEAELHNAPQGEVCSDSATNACDQ